MRRVSGWRGSRDVFVMDVMFSEGAERVKYGGSIYPFLFIYLIIYIFLGYEHHFVTVLKAERVVCDEENNLFT